MTDRADLLLAGPRGRRLLLGLVLDPVVPGWPALAWSGGPAGHPVGRLDRDDARRSLATAVAGADLAALARCTDPVELLPALLGTVDAARYWQEPDDADALLAVDDVAAELRPVADAVAAAPASAWWATALDPVGQSTVRWPTADLTPPSTTGARTALVQWRTDTLLDEDHAVRERPADPRANWGGHWWSTPAVTDRVATTRTLPAGIATVPAPLGLLLVEDEAGWETARTWPVAVPSTARVLEITGPADWTSLVERFPLEVSASRRHDWWRVTGWAGRWAIPDWATVAEEHDGVHLTVDGYLATAGQAWPVGVPGPPVRTVLAGWDPDATWWLTDVAGLGEPADWTRADDEPPRWSTSS
ncbi:hypothetical protein [Modestobacter sp. NPDC049651]|uniref:hypothetical protein n=1 Tax=unclassified Modestobacter TaxID=2643866 RepID=UPI0033D174AF